MTRLAPAASFTPPAYLASAGDASPQAELDRLSTGTAGSRVSLRADPFASATAPVPGIDDASRAVRMATGMQGDDMGSWLSSFLRSPIAAPIAAAIPGVGPAVSSAVAAYQGLVNQGAQPQQAAATVAQQQGLTAEQVQAMILAAQAQQQQQKPDWTKLAMIGGGALVLTVLLASVVGGRK